MTPGKHTHTHTNRSEDISNYWANGATARTVVSLADIATAGDDGGDRSSACRSTVEDYTATSTLLVR